MGRRRRRRMRREGQQPKQRPLRPPQLIRQPYVKKEAEVSCALGVDTGIALALSVFCLASLGTRLDQNTAI
jgi:hypothetical protein